MREKTTSIPPKAESGIHASVWMISFINWKESL